MTKLGLVYSSFFFLQQLLFQLGWVMVACFHSLQESDMECTDKFSMGEFACGLLVSVVHGVELNSTLMTLVDVVLSFGNYYDK